MTSSTEGHPLALTQALCAGVAVLTTPSGVEKVVSPEKMFISSDHTSVALVHSLEQISKTPDMSNFLADCRVDILSRYFTSVL